MLDSADSELMKPPEESQEGILFVREAAVHLGLGDVVGHHGRYKHTRSQVYTYRGRQGMWSTLENTKMFQEHQTNKFL